MKVRSAFFPVMSVIGAVALAVTLAVGAGLAPAAHVSALEGVVFSQPVEPDDAAAILEAKTEPIEAAGVTAAAALTAVPLKAATPIPRANPAKLTKPAAKGARKPSPTTAAGGWRTARSSWYGPGFYGRTMAGGGVLRPDSMVVAHRTLPFGTKVEIEYRGRRVIAIVKDRGPFVRGRTFDLGPGTAKALGFSGVGIIRWRIV